MKAEASLRSAGAEGQWGSCSEGVQGCVGRASLCCDSDLLLRKAECEG